jgi:hypothetical protein
VARALNLVQSFIVWLETGHPAVYLTLIDKYPDVAEGGHYGRGRADQMLLELVDVFEFEIPKDRKPEQVQHLSTKAMLKHWGISAEALTAFKEWIELGMFEESVLIERLQKLGYNPGDCFLKLRVAADRERLKKDTRFGTW